MHRVSNKVIHSDARKVIYNVIKYFDEEKKHGAIKVPLNNATQRAAEATGISERTIVQIRREGIVAEATGSKITTPGKKRKRPTKVSLDDFDKSALRNIIHSIYAVEKEVPTLKKILARARDKIGFKGGRESLRKIMKSIGFRFKKCKNARLVLMEKNDIVAWRGRYLRTMRQNERSGDKKKPVTYIDETWIHPHYTVSKCWQSDNEFGVRKNQSAGQRFIIADAGGVNGFIPNANLIFKAKKKTGDYHDEMNFENFVKWAQEKLLPNLPPNGLIVMDNAPYHSVVENKPPNRSHRKQIIQSWLAEQGVTYEDFMTKAELLELVKIHKPPTKYKIDSLFRQHGHQVVRLPPYHCDLNPIEYIWNILKRRIAEKNVTQASSEIEKLTVDALHSITAEEWKAACEHVQNLEQEYWSKDNLVEEEIERVVVELGGLSSDEDDSDCGESELNDSSSDESGVEPLL